MRATLTELFHVLLQLPLWVLAGMVAATVWAWRSPPATRRHKWRFVLAAACAAFYVASMPAVSSFLLTWLESRHPVPEVTEADRSPDNVILVLTAGWLRKTADGYEQKLGEAGWERTRTADKLQRRIGGRILFTGAPHPNGRESAAGAMARLAVELGAPAEAILVEPASLNTHENLVNSQRLLGPGKRRVWLVTSAIHMPRSVAVARAVGMDVLPYPCDFRADVGVLGWPDLLPANGAHGTLEAAIHELAGMAAYRIRGWGR